MERATIPLPIMAAMETPIAMNPPRLTRFITAGVLKAATAVPAVARTDPPKYLRNYRSKRDETVRERETDM